MKVKQLVFQQYELKDSAKLAHDLFARLNETDKHLNLNYPGGRAAAYTIGKSGLQVEYAHGDGLEARLTVGISAPTRKELRAVRSYLWSLVADIAPDYNLLNIDVIKRKHLAKNQAKPEQ